MRAQAQTTPGPATLTFGHGPNPGDIKIDWTAPAGGAPVEHYEYRYKSWRLPRTRHTPPHGPRCRTPTTTVTSTTRSRSPHPDCKRGQLPCAVPRLRLECHRLQPAATRNADCQASTTADRLQRGRRNKPRRGGSELDRIRGRDHPALRAATPPGHDWRVVRRMVVMDICWHRDDLHLHRPACWHGAHIPAPSRHADRRRIRCCVDDRHTDTCPNAGILHRHDGSIPWRRWTSHGWRSTAPPATSTDTGYPPIRGLQMRTGPA